MTDLSWLRNKENPDVIAHLNRENENCDEYFRPLQQLQDQIYAEIKGRVLEDDSSAPYPQGKAYYYSQTCRGLAYPRHYQLTQLGGTPTLLLDENELGSGHAYFSLGHWDVSPCGRYLAYTTDVTGNEEYTLFIRDLHTQTLLPQTVTTIEGSFVWGHMGKSLYYLKLDAAHRPYQVWRHTPHSDQDDTLLYSETDEAFFVHLYTSKDERYVFIDCSSKTTSEVFAIDVTTEERPQSIMGRSPDVLYTAEHRDGQWIVLTNKGVSPDFHVMTWAVDALEASSPRILIAADPQRRISDIEVFKDYLVLYERYQGLTHFRVLDFTTGELRPIVFSEAAYVVEPEHNEVYDTTSFRYTYESPITSECTYTYNLKTSEHTLLKQVSVPGGFASPDYTLEFLSCPSHDGVSVPLTVYAKKGFPRDGSRPLLLVGYGAYEISREPYFQRSHLSLLDRGFAVAIAHIRGGGELGRRWYESGRQLHKKNSFWDFIACAEFLIREGWTSKDRLGITGGSAGGLLMGAVCNMRPDLFAAVAALVPFVDVLATMSDPSLPLTITEYDEWGNPQDPVYRDYIASYSPVDNVVSADYPAILATAGLNDPRVSYWEPAKWVQRLRERRSNHKTLLLKTDMESGHGGPSGRYAQMKEQATILTFFVHELGQCS